MWQLYLEYEKVLKLMEPFDPQIEMNRQGLDEFTLENSILVFVESTSMSDFLIQKIQFVRQRALPSKVNLNFSLNVEWPPQIDPNNPQHRPLINEILKRFREAVGPKIAEEVRKQIAKQSRVDRIVQNVLSSGWERFTDVS